MLTILFAGCLPNDVGESCTVENKPAGGEYDGEVHIDTDAAECEANLCMSYNERSFCTMRCETDEDCAGTGGGDPAYCEAEIVDGEPADLGNYCVPAYASNLGR